MALSKLTSLTVPEIYDSQEVQAWFQSEVQDFLIPYLESIQSWANGEDIIIHECRTGKPYIKPLQPYVDQKQHTVFGLDADSEMIAQALKKHQNHNFRWLNLDVSDWIDSEDSILPPRKLLSLHSLHAVKDIANEFKTWHNTLFYDGKIWGALLADSDMYKLFSYLKTHPSFKNTVGEELPIPKWIENNSYDPRTLYKDALEAAGFENVAVDLHRRKFEFSSVDAMLETLVVLSPNAFKKYLKAPGSEHLIKDCRSFLLQNFTENSKVVFNYTTLVFSAVKPKPWEEISIQSN